MAAAVHAQSIRRKSGGEPCSGSGRRGPNEETVGKIVAPALGQVAERENVFGVFFCVELDAGIGQGGVVILRNQVSGSISEDKQPIQPGAEAAGEEFADQFLALV